MSLEYCNYCNSIIDTDYDAEHFDECGKDEIIDEKIKQDIHDSMYDPEDDDQE